MQVDSPKLVRSNFSLSDLLTPVDPDPEFVNNLEYRLFRPALVSVESKTRSRSVLLVICLGIFSGVLLLWILKKIIGRIQR